MKQHLQLSFFLLLMVLTSQIGLSATLIVDDTNGSDNGTSPFATIAATVAAV